MSQPLVIKIPLKNKRGDIVAEKEVVSYAGLLARAHDEGLDHVETTIVQLPTAQNGEVAVVRAVVRGKQGTFTGLGDANPSNVNPAVARHLIRIAETRAKARAFRDYTNIGTVALEELGGDEELASEPAVEKQRPVARAASDDRPGMTDAQRRRLWRLALRLGYEGDAAAAFIKERLGVRPDRKATKHEASKLIDELEAQARERGGKGHAA